MWITRRTPTVTMHHMSSNYLVPILIVLAVLNVHTFAPMNPALVVIGCVTTAMYCWVHRTTTPTQALVSIVGHWLLYAPYYCVRRGGHYPSAVSPYPSAVSPYPSACLGGGVLLLYWSLDLWPYCITPVEFALLGVGAYALERLIV